MLPTKKTAPYQSSFFPFEESDSSLRANAPSEETLKSSAPNEEATDGSAGARQLLGLKGAKQETDIWKIRLQLTKPVTWVPLVWGVMCGAAASGNYHWMWNRRK